MTNRCFARFTFVGGPTKSWLDEMRTMKEEMDLYLTEVETTYQEWRSSAAALDSFPLKLCVFSSPACVKDVVWPKADLGRKSQCFTR